MYIYIYISFACYDIITFLVWFAFATKMLHLHSYAEEKALGNSSSKIVLYFFLFTVQ
jgi:hypothetical protein